MAIMKAHDAIIASRIVNTIQANKKRAIANYSEGDLVYLSTKNLSLPKGLARKLAPKYLGPFAITKVLKEGATYQLDLSECHELAFFTFFSLLLYDIDTCCYSPKSYFKHKPYTRYHSFRLLTLFQTIKKIKSACIRTHDVANTTLELQRTARFETRRKQQAI